MSSFQKHITKEDILASINYNMHLEYGISSRDRKHHYLGKQILSVQSVSCCRTNYWIGLSVWKGCQERMTNNT